MKGERRRRVALPSPWLASTYEGPGRELWAGLTQRSPWTRRAATCCSCRGSGTSHSLFPLLMRLPCRASFPALVPPLLACPRSFPQARRRLLLRPLSSSQRVLPHSAPLCSSFSLRPACPSRLSEQGSAHRPAPDGPFSRRPFTRRPPPEPTPLPSVSSRLRRRAARARPSSLTRPAEAFSRAPVYPVTFSFMTHPLLLQASPPRTSSPSPTTAMSRLSEKHSRPRLRRRSSPRRRPCRPGRAEGRQRRRRRLPLPLRRRRRTRARR